MKKGVRKETFRSFFTNNLTLKKSTPVSVLIAQWGWLDLINFGNIINRNISFECLHLIFFTFNKKLKIVSSERIHPFIEKQTMMSQIAVLIILLQINSKGIIEFVITVYSNHPNMILLIDSRSMHFRICTLGSYK